MQTRTRPLGTRDKLQLVKLWRLRINNLLLAAYSCCSAYTIPYGVCFFAGEGSFNRLKGFCSASYMASSRLKIINREYM